MGGQMINVGGHFLSKEAGHLNFVGLHSGGAPVPPPKPGSKRTGAKEGGGGGQGGGEIEKTGKGEGGGDSSSLKGLC